MRAVASSSPAGAAVPPAWRYRRVGEATQRAGGSGLRRYGWVRHDGRTFGVQELLDGHLNITTSMACFPPAPYIASSLENHHSRGLIYELLTLLPFSSGLG